MNLVMSPESTIANVEELQRQEETAATCHRGLHLIASSKSEDISDCAQGMPSF
uniref:Uncharacterized protein n=1 Tax=Hyaloperonospora arabidopsidis (strain Emoy2) TaxID=559515 RepID=M4BF04_HYAAE